MQLSRNKHEKISASNTDHVFVILEKDILGARFYIIVLQVCFLMRFFAFCVYLHFLKVINESDFLWVLIL